jgi:hypothetical protein
MDNSRIQLKVLGISYNPLRTGAYALLLAEVNGPKRIVVVIGSSEAQSIALKVENITTPRPLTHDLFADFIQAYGVKLVDVFIYKFDDGIFYSELTFDNGEQRVTLDARTSDAIAIALRTNAAIYTTRAILEETGFIIEDETDDVTKEINSILKPAREHSNADDEIKSISELETKLSKLIEEERYEEASKVSELLDRRRDEYRRQHPDDKQ